MNRFEQALIQRELLDNDTWWDDHKDAIEYALKLAAKLEQEPSEGMVVAGDQFDDTDNVFKAMYEQAKREIE